MNIALRISRPLAEPVCKHLVLALKDAIESGQLQAGDQLPTTRELAFSLQIARGTVVKAYRELINRGYLAAKRGYGTVVSANPPEVSQPLINTVNIWGAEPALSNFGQRLTQMTLPGNTSFDLAELNHGCAAREFLPVKRWRELTNRYCRSTEYSKPEYVTDPFGYEPLRAEIGRFLLRTKGVRCGVDQIMTFTSTQRILDFALSLLINAGETVAVEDPGYGGIRDNATACGARLFPVPIDQDGLIPSFLPDSDQSCQLLHTSPECQDPTGVTLSEVRKHELAEWARRTDAYIIEDAWDSAYHYGGPVNACLQSICPERVLYIYTPWKVLYPLTMMGFLILPKPLIPAFRRLKLITDRHSPELDALVLTDFISEGHLDKHIDSVLKIYRQRRQSIIFALKTCFREKIALFPKTSGLHLRFQLMLEADDSEILAAAKRMSVPLVSTQPYYFGAAQRGEFLMQFTLEAVETLVPKIMDLASVLNSANVYASQLPG